MWRLINTNKRFKDLCEVIVLGLNGLALKNAVHIHDGFLIAMNSDIVGLL